MNSPRRRDFLKAVGTAVPALTATGLATAVGGTARTVAGPLPVAPTAEWTSMLPTVAFEPGVAGCYDLTRYTKGFDARLHEMRLAPASAPLPEGVTLDPKGMLRYDGAGLAGYVPGLVIEIQDALRIDSG